MREDFSSYQVIIPNIDSPNANGRVYTMETAEKILEALQNPKRCFVTLNIPKHDYIDLEDVCAVVESTAIVNNQLVGVIRPLGTPTGKLLKEMLIAERDNPKILSFRTAGRADAVVNGKMINYMFLCVFACPYQEN